MRIRQVLKHRSFGISCLFAGSTAAFSVGPTKVLLEKKKGADTGEDEKPEHVPFDLTKEWTVQRGPDFLKNLIFTDETNPEVGSPEKKREEGSSPIDSFLGWAASKLIAPTPYNDDKTNEDRESFLSAVRGFAGLLVGTGKYFPFFQMYGSKAKTETNPRFVQTNPREKLSKISFKGRGCRPPVAKTIEILRVIGKFWQLFDKTLMQYQSLSQVRWVTLI
jgi:hypothetical protein